MIPSFKKNAATFSLLGFIFATFLFYEPARMVLYRLMHNCAYPFIEVGNAIGQPINNYLQKRKSISSLLTENQALHEQIESLQGENVTLAATLSYLSRSHDLAQFQERYQLSQAILGKVLEKQLDEHEHSFLINAGKRDGVTTNMVAIYKFQLIGKVVEVHECYSKILLITDKNCKVAAYSKIGNHAGIAQGTNKINEIIFTYVNKLAEITHKDLVLSSGEGMLFPEGFCLGTIKTIDTQELYHHIKLETIADFPTINFCLLTNQDKISCF